MAAEAEQGRRRAVGGSSAMRSAQSAPLSEVVAGRRALTAAGFRNFRHECEQAQDRRQQ